MVKDGYKQTDIGMIPEDWGVKSLDSISNITMGQSPKSMYYNNLSIGLPLVQGNADISNRKTIIRNYTSQITKKAFVNDIIMSVRAPVGEIAKNLFDCCIGRGVCAISTKSEYLYHYLVYYENEWGNLSKGSTFDSINSNEVRKLLIPIPPKEEQKAIAKALSDTDELITSLEKLISKKEAIKQGTMQQLLTGKKRLSGFTGDWEEKKLGDFLAYEQPTNYLVSSAKYTENGEVPVLTAGKTFILGYTSEENGIFNNLPTIIFDDFTTASKFVDFPFKAKSSAMKMLIPQNDKVNMRFMYEIMSQIKYQVGDHKRHWIGEFRNLEILVPSTSDEQQAIAQILSDMDDEIEILKQKLTKTKAIKDGIMSELLTGKTRLKVKDE